MYKGFWLVEKGTVVQKCSGVSLGKTAIFSGHRFQWEVTRNGTGTLISYRRHHISPSCHFIICTILTKGNGLLWCMNPTPYVFPLDVCIGLLPMDVTFLTDQRPLQLYLVSRTWNNLPCQWSFKLMYNHCQK